MSNLLEIHNLTKTYPGVVALDNFTMDVRQGSAWPWWGKRGRKIHPD